MNLSLLILIPAVTLTGILLVKAQMARVVADLRRHDSEQTEGQPITYMLGLASGEGGSRLRRDEMSRRNACGKTL